MSFPEYNLADLFEHAVDHFGTREYLVCEGKRRTYAQMEERANRLAHHLAAHGIGPGDHVGIYAYNSVEWVETLWAVFKLRAVWVNINYRYVEEELSYLFDNADLKALVYAREFAPRVRGVLHRLPMPDMWRVLSWAPAIAGVEHGPRIFSQPTCHHAPQVYGGIEEQRAGELLRSFFARRR